MHPAVHDPISALTFATMHRDELIADARARRRAREAKRASRSRRSRRRPLSE